VSRTTQGEEAHATLSSRFTSDCSSVSMRKIGSVGSSSCTAAIEGAGSGRGSPAVFAYQSDVGEIGALPLRKYRSARLSVSRRTCRPSDADHLAVRFGATVHPEPAAERVLIRPQATGQRFVDDPRPVALRLRRLAAKSRPRTSGMPRVVNTGARSR